MCVSGKCFKLIETAIHANDIRGRGFAPRGETPIIHTTAKYENLSLISAITNKGRVHWMITNGTVNIERFLEFLKSLIKYSRQKIYLILDNLKVHHALTVKDWVTKHASRTKEHLHEAAESHLEMLRTSPERIQKYFEDPAIAYATI